MIKDEDDVKWCQFCNHNTSSLSSCQKENDTSFKDGTTLPLKSFIDFESLEVNNLKALTFHVKGYHGRIYATTSPSLSNKDLPIFSIKNAYSNAGYTQNPLNFFKSQQFEMELNNTFHLKYILNKIIYLLKSISSQLV